MDFSKTLKDLNMPKPKTARVAVEEKALPDEHWNKAQKQSCFVEIGKALCQLHVGDFKTQGYVDLDDVWKNIAIQNPDQPDPKIFTLNQLMDEIIKVLNLEDKGQIGKFITAWNPKISQFRDKYPAPFNGMRAYIALSVPIIKNTPEFHVERMIKNWGWKKEEFDALYQKIKTESGLKEIREPYDFGVLSRLIQDVNKRDANKNYFLCVSEYMVDCCKYIPKKAGGSMFKAIFNSLKWDETRQEWTQFEVASFYDSAKMIGLNEKLIYVDGMKEPTLRYTGSMTDDMFIICKDLDLQNEKYWNLSEFTDLWN